MTRREKVPGGWTTSVQKAGVLDTCISARCTCNTNKVQNNNVSLPENVGFEPSCEVTYLEEGRRRRSVGIATQNILPARFTQLIVLCRLLGKQ
jgi:hypothetical protein